jgi:hypothetical protein
MGKDGQKTDYVIEDGLSRHLDTLSNEERRPMLEKNELRPSGPSFDAEELEAAFSIVCPH